MTHATTTVRSGAATLLALALLALAGCGGSDTSAPAAPELTVTQAASVTLLTPSAASDLVGDPAIRVLDVRTAEEFAEGHLPGAVRLDWYASDFADRVAELDHDATWVVYCRSGNRSAQATALMADQGFTAVNDVDGGIVAWQAAGLPVVTGP